MSSANDSTPTVGRHCIASGPVGPPPSALSAVAPGQQKGSTKDDRNRCGGYGPLWVAHWPRGHARN